MDPKKPHVVDNETTTKKIKPKIVLDNATFMEFVSACLTELQNGNRPGTHFNKVGWANLEKTMKEKTGKVLDKKQLKNIWDNMKKDWKLYDRLMRIETGIGGTRSLLDASPEWWEEKIKVDKDFAKFRDTNLEIYETHYAPLFRDSVAVGDQTMNPLQFQDNTPNDVQCEQPTFVEDSDDNDSLFPTFVERGQSSTSKRKKSKDINTRMSKSKITSFEEKLDVVLEALATKSSLNNPVATIADCMSIVITYPGFDEGSKKYSKALHFLTKKPNREAFMFPTTNDGKMEYLKLLMED